MRSPVVRSLLPLILLASAPEPARAAATSGATAFVGVTVIPADRERLLPDQTVVVRGGRIVALGPARKVKVPPDATRVDGAGKFLMPGLAELHGHLPDPRVPEELALRYLKLFVAAGVTTVRGMLGAPNQLELRKKIAAGEVLGPRLIVYSPPFSGGNTATPEVATERVREYKEAGYDGLKILEGLAPATYEAIARAARRHRIPFGGHVPNEVGLERALAAGQTSIDHLDGFIEALVPPGTPDDPAEPKTVVGVASPVPLARVDESRLPRLVAATRKAGAVVVPTLVVWRTLFGDPKVDELRALPELAYMPSATVDGWIRQVSDRMQKGPDLAALGRLVSLRDAVLRALAAGGATIVLGADAPQTFNVPGFSLRNEVAAMVKAGMTPWQVIQSGTSAPTRFLGLAREAGTVAVGKRADLLLLDGNPLEDVGNVFRSAGVMVNGRWLPRAELDALLAEIEKAR